MCSLCVCLCVCINVDVCTRVQVPVEAIEEDIRHPGRGLKGGCEG